MRVREMSRTPYEALASCLLALPYLVIHCTAVNYEVIYYGPVGRIEASMTIRRTSALSLTIRRWQYFTLWMPVHNFKGLLFLHCGKDRWCELLKSCFALVNHCGQTFFTHGYTRSLIWQSNDERISGHNPNGCERGQIFQVSAAYHDYCCILP